MRSAPHGLSVRQRVQLYIDDIVVHSRSASHHVDNLRGSLARLTEYNLKLSPKKAHIGAPEVQFLGHLVTPSGLRPDPKKIDAMLRMPMPPTEDNCVLFWVAYRIGEKNCLVCLQLLRIYIPWCVRMFASSSLRITRLLRSLKQLVSSEVLGFPDYQAANDGSRKFQLVTDASKKGFGASLEQKQPDGKIRPLLCISRTTLPSKKNWDTSE